MTPFKKENAPKKHFRELNISYVLHKDAELGDVLKQCRRVEVRKAMDAGTKQSSTKEIQPSHLILPTILAHHSNKSHLFKSSTPPQLLTAIVRELYRLKDETRPPHLPIWNWERSIRVLGGELKQRKVVIVLLIEFVGFNWEGFSDVFEYEMVEGSDGEDEAREEDEWMVV